MAIAKHLPEHFLVRLCFLLLPLFISQRLQAQTTAIPADSSAARVFLHNDHTFSETESAHPAKSFKLSPVAKSAALVAVGAGVWTATFAFADEPLQKYTQSHRTTVADKLAYVVQPMGRQHYLAPLAGAAIAGGLLWKDSRLEKAGLLSLGSILISAGVTSTIKNQFHRHRPNTTTENHMFDGPVRQVDNTSLPSAHTATAFAVATSIAKVYGNDYKFVPPLAYGVATLVGLSRINDNAHWATDVMAGAAVGYFSAKGANYLYDIANQKLMIHKQRRLLITPQPGLQSGNVSATLVF